jgi:hypothetical protein
MLILQLLIALVVVLIHPHQSQSDKQCLRVSMDSATTLIDPQTGVSTALPTLARAAIPKGLVSNDGRKYVTLEMPTSGNLPSTAPFEIMVHTLDVPLNDLQRRTVHSPDAINMIVSWSPDDRYIVYEYFSGVTDSLFLGIADNTGKTLKEVALSWNGSPMKSGIRWSADGQYFQLLGYHDDNLFLSFRSVPDLSEVPPYNLKTIFIVEDKCDDGYYAYFKCVVLSPAGHNLALYQNNKTQGELTLLELGTSNIHRFAVKPTVNKEVEMLWSPDGKYLAFKTTSSSGNEFAIYGMDGTIHANIDPNIFLGGPPTHWEWTVDSTSLLYLSIKASSSSDIEVMRYDIATKEKHVIGKFTKKAHHYELMPAPDNATVAMHVGGSARKGDSLNMRLMPLDGTGHIVDIPLLPESEYQEYQWSPDGSLMAVGVRAVDGTVVRLSIYHRDGALQRHTLIELKQPSGFILGWQPCAV